MIIIELGRSLATMIVIDSAQKLFLLSWMVVIVIVMVMLMIVRETITDIDEIKSMKNNYECNESIMSHLLLHHQQQQSR